jgi:hypothetical protein
VYRNFPSWIDLGTGVYADDFSVTVFGLALVTPDFLAGAAVTALVSMSLSSHPRPAAPAE